MSVHSNLCHCSIDEIGDDLVVTLQCDNEAVFRDIAERHEIHYVVMPHTPIKTFRVHTDALGIHMLLTKLVMGESATQLPSEQMFSSLWDACNCVMSDAVSYVKVRDLVVVY